MPTVDAWWFETPKPGNFGDILTPILLKEVFGWDCNLVKKTDKPCLIGVGSTISLANANSVFWGSGIAGADRNVHPRPKRYLSVRGPLTRRLIIEKGTKIDVPEIYGDPALLLPEFFNPTVEKKYKYGLTAHLHDNRAVSDWYRGDPDIKVINLLNADPYDVIRQILECERIASSSLHGIITAQAYGIPTAWVEHSDKVNGDGTKFHDYLESVQLEEVAFQFREKLSVAELDTFRYQHDIQIDMEPVKQALQEYLAVV